VQTPFLPKESNCLASIRHLPRVGSVNDLFYPYVPIYIVVYFMVVQVLVFQHICLLYSGKIEVILEKLEADPIEKKLGHYMQKW
jgi:hypothetical protein